MQNPLEALEGAAKTNVQNLVNWAFNGGKRNMDSNQKGKTDGVFKKQPMDVLRRAAYHNVFDSLFVHGCDDFPYVTPDKTLEKVIGKVAFNMFPRKTAFTCAEEASNALLKKVLEQTKFDLKTEPTVKESALMGYCGLRSVWVDDIQKWLLETVQKEYLVIESMPGIPGEIVAIGMEWPVERKEGKATRIYWKKERWTKDLYQVWPEKAQPSEGKPEFKPEEAKEEPNNYGEIPYTIIPHMYDAKLHGVGIVGDSEILFVKSIIRLRHKRHFGHLKFMDPNPIRINHSNPDQPLDMGIAKVIDLQQADPNMPTDLKLLQFAGMPESVKEEIYDNVKALYEAAGLKAPPPEDVFKAGTDVSGVALRIRDKDDADTIETLRDGGYSNILRHLEKILRMGATLGLPEFSLINPENPETWTVAANYPDFFAPTDEEITAKLMNMKMADLPPELAGPAIAALFGYEEKDQIDAITQAQIEKKALQEAAMLDPGPGNN